MEARYSETNASHYSFTTSNELFERREHRSSIETHSSTQLFQILNYKKISGLIVKSTVKEQPEGQNVATDFYENLDEEGVDLPNDSA